MIGRILGFKLFHFCLVLKSVLCHASRLAFTFQYRFAKQSLFAIQTNQYPEIVTLCHDCSVLHFAFLDSLAGSDPTIPDTTLFREGKGSLLRSGRPNFFLLSELQHLKSPGEESFGPRAHMNAALRTLAHFKTQ